jgi:hypothetical protein
MAGLSPRERARKPCECLPLLLARCLPKVRVIVSLFYTLRHYDYFSVRVEDT